MKSLHSARAQALWNGECLWVVDVIRRIVAIGADTRVQFGEVTGYIAREHTSAAFLLFGDPSAPEPQGLMRFE